MPEGMVRERLNIYYLLDTSGSMYGARIQQLNTVMQELKPVLEEAAIDNNVEIIVRAIEFGNDDTAKWHRGEEASGITIDNFTWVNLEAKGYSTPTSMALQMVTKALNPEFLGTRALRPVVIMVTDGGCTDGASVYTAACNDLKKKIGGVTTRIAIGIGDTNKAQLEEFATVGIVGEDTNRPFAFDAKNAETLAEVIRWASVVSIKSSVNTSIKTDEEATDEDSSENAVELTDPEWEWLE